MIVKTNLSEKCKDAIDDDFKYQNSQLNVETRKNLRRTLMESTINIKVIYSGVIINMLILLWTDFSERVTVIDSVFVLQIQFIL